MRAACREAVIAWVGSWVVAACGAGAAAADVLPGAHQRFARADVAEVPDFQRHVIPLLGKLGCNGRACHGSFQGRGGFRLSLFGFDFDRDYQALLRAVGDEGRVRVEPKQPQRSLILQKPTLAIAHEGGLRFQSDGWQYALLHRWIAAGAPRGPPAQHLVTLHAEPAELELAAPGQSASIRLVARWEDGTVEDVTPLCRFQSNDEAVATIDEHGRITATGRGDTHVVALYDNLVAAIPVLIPVSPETAAHYPEVATATTIDRLVVDRLRRLGIVPSPTCSDAEFLRRASIDITGTLPTPQEVTQFLADRDPDKRRRKIDELLQRPEYAAWWANKLCDFTGCNPRQQSESGQELSVLWYAWLRRRLEQNVPYDQIVAGIVLASGRTPGQSYQEYAAEMSAYFRDREPADFAQRETMPFYWSRAALRTADDRALAFAHSFLGIRLQCAQCHKHPYDRWTQQDFQNFSALFGGLRYGIAPESRDEYRALAARVGVPANDQGVPVQRDLLARAQGGETVPWREVYVVPAGSLPGSILGTQLPPLARGGDPRVALMAWLRDKDHPWFARALVNRVWGTYFHRGIVEPTDDANPANPPVNGPLLDYLAQGFVEHGYDLKWLHREITTSDTYQRSWRPSSTNAADRRHFSRAVPRRLPAEVVYDALKQVVAASSQLEQVRTELDRRAIGHLSMRMAGTYAMQVFGKPERATNCDCERNNTPSLLQAIFLHNDPLVEARLQEGGWWSELSRLDVRQRVEPLVVEAYLRTLGRPPSDAELQRAAQHVAAAPQRVEGMRDLVWALVNTKEFLLNH